MPPDLTIVLPTYNEVENLEEAVRRIRASNAAVLIVDDGSPDGTGELADRLAGEDADVSVLHRNAKEGLGAAYGAGFDAALAGGADLIGQMDADLSHDPADLPRLRAAVVAGADVAIGSRYVPSGSTKGWSWLRRTISRGANWYVRHAMAMSVRDATAGFRVYRADVLRLLDPSSCRSAGYVFQVEMTYRTEQRGLRIEEVPITFIERSKGASKMSVGIAVEAMWLISAWGARRLWGKLRSAT